MTTTISLRACRGVLGSALTGALAFGMVMYGTACDYKAPLPTGVQDPATYNTPSGAVAQYRAALVQYQRAYFGMLSSSGLLTDEFHAPNIGAQTGTYDPQIVLDSRLLGGQTAGAVNSQSDPAYGDLQQVRGLTRQALGALAAYAPASPASYRGEMYALNAAAEIALADLFCSGVPLSMLDYGKDFTYKPGSSATAVYENALLLLDTAATLGADSARVLNLARVLRGRALLALGRYADAATAVADVPEGFTYQLPGVFADAISTDNSLYTQFTKIASVSDREGGSGLAFRTDGDPRTAAVIDASDNHTIIGLHGDSLFMPGKYSGAITYTVGDWIEARLIQAEAQLQAGQFSDWLATLNHLRETAISPALSDLSDPGLGALPPGKTATDVRVDLLFTERAGWLFATGHRQGDLRRLVRQYERSQDLVYPSGTYPGGQGQYGGDVTASIPTSERANPYFKGCLDRNA